MGTIVARPRKSGGIAYLAKITIKRNGKTVHTEAKTHETEPAARRWMLAREAELSDPATLANVTSPTSTLADAITRYLIDRRDLGRTKEQVLNAIQAMPISRKPAEKLTAKDIIDLARSLNSRARKPQTVQNYLSHLAPVIRLSRSAYGVPIDPTIAIEAMAVARDLGMTATSQRRDRRPTIEELNRLADHFSQRTPDLIPMAEIMAFALFSARRCEEITKLRWNDFEGDRILVRDMKHPRAKKFDCWCDVRPEAAAIIRDQPRAGELIFPYRAPSISSAFTRAVGILGIADLRFHDLRHEAISRLFELGLDIPRVAAVSGHRSWQNLQRYTHIRQSGDRLAGWTWKRK